MSSDTAELKKLVKQLQGASSESDVIDIIALLKKDFVVNEQILRESKAGLAVGKLRNHKAKAVADAAKDVVKKWKHDVERAKEAHSASSSPTASKAPAKAAPLANATTARKNSTVGRATGGGPRSAKSDGISVNVTGDKIRDKCLELVYDALAMDATAPASAILDLAASIERKVFAMRNYTTSADYKSKIRQLYSNLRDQKNPGLREAVFSGAIKVEQLCEMTPDQLANEEQKAELEKIKEANLFSSLGAGEQQAETDAFQCSRCKQRKCRYRQAQTRSADEPMTTFVTCVNCNNRWKFS